MVGVFQELLIYWDLLHRLSGSELVADASNVTVLSPAVGQDAAATAASFVKMVGPQFQLVTLPLTASQGSPVRQQITVVDATATVADNDDLQEAVQAEGGDEGQQEEEEEEEEQQ